MPVILLFGAYIFVNGHLTPGGGFQGGAVLASGVLLMILADPDRRFSHGVISRIESEFRRCSTCSSASSALALAGGFLDNRILPLGRFGTHASRPAPFRSSTR